MGKLLVRRILSGELGTPRKIIVFSRDEAKQHSMRLSYMHKTVSTDEVIYRNFQETLEFRIGDVNNYDEICSAVQDADIIANAAALKQVPTCEYFPLQAIKTNCLGPSNIVRAIREHKMPVETVIGISTDKACKPVNVMGMTKAIQERIFISANILAEKTRFICVRYGNVLASRGSVVPMFHDQIAAGGPVTITVPEMTRFLLSINQAVDLVFAALQGAKPGEIYVPRIPATTIEDLAKALIGERNIEIKIIGIRPGEKLHEIMISDEEAHRVVQRDGNYVIKPMLPELVSDQQEKSAGLTKEYSSDDDVASLEETAELLKKNKLMVGDVNLTSSGELLR